MHACSTFCESRAAFIFFENVGGLTFVILVFGSMYICEETFSRMKAIENSEKSSQTDDHLHATLRTATMTSFLPNISELTCVALGYIFNSMLFISHSHFFFVSSILLVYY